ncbi:uncharacterized protein YggE [Virgibacillus halotolerans]|uniref:SIMPL domain-containing protein n=1 Tax=Virgibacillus halotolerans TaxID=1071053 RepID=UPI001961CFDA|nr:SIMPL domain-containing protein [Virgibacillus halotolerans]MBM7600374.1 uncharacterized protein YggE [Virgibacillus halotolerans]
MYYPMTNQYRQDMKRMMTVTGEASLSFEPDKVTIQLGTVTENEQLSQAQQENARKMNQVIQSLLQLGIPKENIQTTAYNINPMYDYIDGKQQFRGYQVSNAITVQMTNIDQAGKVIDIAVQNDVNRVSDIHFSMEDNQIPYQQALSAALKNAIAKAQTIAETLEVNYDPIPTKIMEIINDSPTAYKTFAVMENSNSTPIEPGEITVNAMVEAQFQY